MTTTKHVRLSETFAQAWSAAKVSPYRLLKEMDPAKVYPRYVLINCALLARELSRGGGKMIDADFVRAHRKRLENIETGQERLV